MMNDYKVYNLDEWDGVIPEPEADDDFYDDSDDGDGGCEQCGAPSVAHEEMSIEEKTTGGAVHLMVCLNCGHTWSWFEVDYEPETADTDTATEGGA